MNRVALPLILIAAYGLPDLANAVDQTRFVNDVVKVKQIVQLLQTMSRKVLHEREQENTLYKEINHYCSARHHKAGVTPQAHAAPAIPHTDAKKAVAQAQAVAVPKKAVAPVKADSGADELADKSSTPSDDSVDESAISDTSSTDDQDGVDVSSVDAAEAAAERVEQEVEPVKDSKIVAHQEQPLQMPKKATHLATAPVVHSAAQINAAVSAALDDVATNVPDAGSKKTDHMAQVQAAGDPDEELQEVQGMLKATGTPIAEEPPLSGSQVSTQPQQLTQALDDLATEIPDPPMTSKKSEHAAQAQAAADPDEELKEVQVMVKDTDSAVAEVPSVAVSHVQSQPTKLQQAQSQKLQAPVSQKKTQPEALKKMQPQKTIKAQKLSKVQQKQQKVSSSPEKTLPPQVASPNMQQKLEAVFGDDGHVEAAEDDSDAGSSNESLDASEASEEMDDTLAPNGDSNQADHDDLIQAYHDHQETKAAVARATVAPAHHIKSKPAAKETKASVVQKVAPRHGEKTHRAAGRKSKVDAKVQVVNRQSKSAPSATKQIHKVAKAVAVHSHASHVVLAAPKKHSRNIKKTSKASSVAHDTDKELQQMNDLLGVSPIKPDKDADAVVAETESLDAVINNEEEKLKAAAKMRQGGTEAQLRKELKASVKSGDMNDNVMTEEKLDDSGFVDFDAQASSAVFVSSSAKKQAPKPVKAKAVAKAAKKNKRALATKRSRKHHAQPVQAQPQADDAETMQQEDNAEDDVSLVEKDLVPLPEIPLAPKVAARAPAKLVKTPVAKPVAHGLAQISDADDMSLASQSEALDDLVGVLPNIEKEALQLYNSFGGEPAPLESLGGLAVVPSFLQVSKHTPGIPTMAEFDKAWAQLRSVAMLLQTTDDKVAALRKPAVALMQKKGKHTGFADIDSQCKWLISNLEHRQRMRSQEEALLNEAHQVLGTAHSFLQQFAEHTHLRGRR